VQRNSTAPTHNIVQRNFTVPRCRIAVVLSIDGSCKNSCFYHRDIELPSLRALRPVGALIFLPQVGYDAQCQQAEVEFQKHTYTELAKNTKFALIVEGFGYHSFRLTEVH